MASAAATVRSLERKLAAATRARDRAKEQHQHRDGLVKSAARSVSRRTTDTSRGRARTLLDSRRQLRAKWSIILAWRRVRVARLSRSLARWRRRADRPAPTPRGGDASEHLRISEFDCHDGTRVPSFAHQGLRHLARDVLEPMRTRFGPCHVTSGYRHASYNRRIGGASRSYHNYDLRRGSDQVAADVTFASGSPADWAFYARQLGIGGVGEYRRSRFVHVDNGPRRQWRGN